KPQTSILLEGNGENLSLQYFFQSSLLADVLMDIEYKAEFVGESVNDATGVLNINIPFATANEDTLKPQLIYADVANLSPTNRSIRVTTTAADISLEGNYTISSLLPLTNYWISFFKERLENEFFTESFSKREIKTDQKLGNQDFNITAQLKDVNLIKKYLPN
ncbi:MAG TPA: hypothetical protein DCX27_15110, partial [Balneola sp.]|nr:hypothetical protein [Balneola sp.]